MTPVVLPLMLLLLVHGSSVASITCSPANLCFQGKCLEVHSSDEGCPENIVNQDALGSSNDCVLCSLSKSYGTLPQPSNLTLSVRPYSTTHFELHMSWNPPSGAENLEGYKINIIANAVLSKNNDLLAPEDQYGCHCASSNATEKTFEVTYSYQNQYQLCKWEDDGIFRTLTVEVISVPYSSVSVIGARQYISWPTDCLSIQPPDYAICGPPIPHMPVTNWTTELLPSSPGFMAVTFDWEEPDNVVPGYIPSEYFISLYVLPDVIDVANFGVKNTTGMTISPLNASRTYIAYIEVYLPCVVGNEICTDQMTDFSCSESYYLGQISYEPPPIPSTTSMVASGTKLTSAFAPSASLSSSLSSTLSPTHPSSFPHPSSTGPSTSVNDESENPLSATLKLVLVVGGACFASVLLVIVLLVVTVLLVRKNGICSKKYSGRFRLPLTSPPPSERSTPNIFQNCNGFEFLDSSSSTPKAGMQQQQQQVQKMLQNLSPTPDEDEAIMARSDPSKHRVVFIYSDRTPKEDCDLIAVYRRRLESQGDIATSVYDISLRQPTSTWLAEEVRVANAVFCVCNKEFQQDWKNGGGRLSRSPVHALKLQVDSCVNSRHHPAMLYAIVVLYEKDLQYVPEGSYLKVAVNFLLCEEKLEEIFRFVRQEREYILPS